MRRHEGCVRRPLLRRTEISENTHLAHPGKEFEVILSPVLKNRGNLALLRGIGERDVRSFIGSSSVDVIGFLP